MNIALNHKKSPLLPALYFGSLWGIFESTIGYLLHLSPVRLGFLIWFPAACYFLAKAYSDSGKPYAILLTAVLAASIKLLNLFLPGSIDRVINPAISILFEGVAVYAAIHVYNKMKLKDQKKIWPAAPLFLGANCLWRLMFVGYLAFIVPQWMRDASVLRSAESLIKFLVTDNLWGSAAAFAGYGIIQYIHGQIAIKGNFRQPYMAGRWGTACLLAVNIGLQLFLG